jgi:hypothetical protein
MTTRLTNMGSRWIARGALFCALVLAVRAFAQAPAGDVAPVFEAYNTDGKALSGAVESLTPEGHLRIGSKDVKSGTWLTLRRQQLPLPARPRGAQVVLTSGDRIPLADKAAVKIADDCLHFPATVKGPAFTPPRAVVALLWLACPDGADGPVLLRQLLAEPRKHDLILLRDGDRVEGTVMGLDSAKGCQVQEGKRLKLLPWDTIGVIAFNRSPLISATPERTHYHLVLDDGSRLTLTAARVAKDGKALTGETVFDAKMEVSLDRVIALDVRRGPATYLSDLQPSKYEHTSFLGPSWPLVADGSVTGGELRLAGSTFDKGLGTHAECRVRYDLAGKYRWLEARVGLDPEHGQRGRVKIRVLVDGKERDLGAKKELTARDEPLLLRVDVQGGKELTLEVLCAGFGDVQAHVSWADARLVE